MSTDKKARLSGRDAGPAALGLLALAGGLALVLGAGRAIAPTICGVGVLDVIRIASLGSFDILWQTASSWFLMLLVMTPALLIAPMRHLWDCCFADQRMRSIGLFGMGYLAVWTAAGAPLLLAAAAIREIQFAPALVASALVFVWQISPAKQACLNRCHRRPSLAAFGVRAAGDALRYGAITGAWCVGACWPVMLGPLVVPGNEVAVMSAAAIFVAAERLEPPRPVGWGLRIPMRLVRLATMNVRQGAARWDRR